MVIFGAIIAVIGLGYLLYLAKIAPKGSETDEGFRREK